MTKDKQQNKKFPGVPVDWCENNFWMVPRMLDNYWSDLKKSEFIVLFFILRKIFGWKGKIKQGWDYISMSQIKEYTGIKHNETISKNLKSLAEKDFIKVEKTNKYKKYGRGVNKISIVMLTDSDNVVESKNHSKNDTDDSKNDTDDSKNEGSGSKNEHTINTNNKELNINNKIEKLFRFFQKRICNNARLTKKGRKKIEKRLAEFDIEDLAKAIKRFSQTRWRMLNHASKGPDWFFESEERIAEFMNLRTDMTECEATGYNETGDD